MGMSTNTADRAIPKAADQSDVPAGYKRTEVGVIPDDWHIALISEIADVKTGPFGSALHESDYVKDGTPIITVEHLGEQGVEHVNLPLVSDMDRARLATYTLHDGDIVFSRVGSVDRNALIRTTEEGWLFSGRLLRVRVVDQDVHPPYLSYHFHSEPFKHRVRTVAVGQTMASLNTQILKSVNVILPTSDEQNAIASALSDMDGLIAAFEKLIAKKRAIKQAAMQQLLTGKTRLPGFTGEWTTRRLGDHVTFLSHGTNSRAELLLDGPVKYLHYGDVHAATLAVLEPTFLPSLPEQKAARLDRLRDGDLVFVDASEDMSGISKSVEIRGAGDTELVAGLHTITARFDKRVLADGFKAYLQFCPAFAGQLRRLAAGTKVYATNRSHIASVEMQLPGTDEQSAIASIFQDMDAEIASLQHRRDKTQQIKQGMMQQLLTGRVRLVEPGEAAS
jgi:type I restriction enzyme, S subunit